MKRIFVLIMLMLLPIVAACSSDNGKQQLETAQFEEKQNNFEHAIKLYEEVVKKYPGSASAKTAQERLKDLTANK
jgi:outer membrane protein assembly factor BamD (BamD/ComL family)